MKGKFFLDRDDSSHWYLVPLDKSKEWRRWSRLDEDDPKYGITPQFAKMINSPFNITFENPEII